VADDQVPPSKLKRRLTTLDSSFLYGETASNPLHIGSLAIFEGKIPFEDVVRAVKERIHLLPRYRQRLVPVPLNLAHATLEDDPGFKVENHIKRCQMPAGLTEAEMVDHALRVYHPILKRDRPLWEMLWFDRWTGGNTAIISKTHHALVDGVSGVELIKVMYDFRPDAPPPAPPANEWKPGPLPGVVERLLDAAHDVLGAQIDAAYDLARGAVRDPRMMAETAQQMIAGVRQLAPLGLDRIATTPWNGGLVTSRRSLAWLRNSFAEYRAIRGALGGTVNDVVLAVLSEGAARYLKHHGYSNDRPLRIGCPVNVRRREEMSDLGNRVSMMFPTLPAVPMDVADRLALVHEETTRLIRSGAPHALERLNSIAEAAPASLLALASRAGLTAVEAAAAVSQLANWAPRPGGWLMPAIGINFVATNVPGVQVPQYFCGHRCLDQIGLLPLGANLGYGVAILSYNGNLYLGMMAEPRMIPDIELMKAFVNDAFEELKATAQSRTTKVVAGAPVEISIPRARSAAPMPIPAPGA
jgi:diacylglycerol O-acyltransferase / wax synthase